MIREYFLLKKTIYLETGEMSKWLGEGNALTEDASAVSSTCIRRLTIACNSSSRESMPSSGLHGYSTHKYIAVVT